MARTLIEIWVSRFGVPLIITPDQGGRFESSLFRSLSQFLGIHHIHTTAYQLKASTKAQPNSIAWTEVILLRMLGIRIAIKSVINCSAAELMYGSPRDLSGEFSDSTANNVLDDVENYVHRVSIMMRDLQHTYIRAPSTRYTSIATDTLRCKHVSLRHDIVRKPLQPP